MTMRAGSHEGVVGSLAEAMEAAFAAELWALRAAQLPEVGEAERRMLFAAIAQGVLQFLARADADISAATSLAGNHQPVHFETATLTRSGQVYAAEGFTTAPRVTRLDTGVSIVAAQVVGLGADRWEVTLTGVPTGTVVDARDANGNAAQVVR